MAEAALAVAIASVVIAYWQGRNNARAIKAEERDRREQLALLREQVEAETRQREAQALARVVVTAGQSQNFPGRFEQEFHATNGGPAIARNVMAFLANADGRNISGKVYPASHGAAPLIAGQTAHFPLVSQHSAGRPAWCVVEWEDDAGKHETRVAATPPP